MKDRFAIALLILLPALFWWPLLAGYLPDFMDTVTCLYPMRVAAARELLSGSLPLWNPHLFSGVPLAANPQVAVWYPPQWLFFAWPSAIANGLVLLAHYWIGGIGLYKAARRLGLLVPAALFGALTFQFGSMMVSRIALTPHLYAAAWIPWMLWGVERWIASPSPRRLIPIAVFVALQILAGAPQITYYTALILPIYWLVRTWQMQPGSVAAILRRVLPAGIIAGLVAGLLAGIQLLPTLDFLGQSARGELSVEKISGQGLAGGFVWRALVGYTGDPIEDTDSINAIGIGSLLLLVPALMRRRRGVAVLLCAMGVFSFLLSLSVLVPYWSRVLPLFSGFHAPRRALILWSVLGPIAAAIGAHNLLLVVRRRFPQWRLAPLALLLLLGSGSIWLLPRLERVYTPIDRFDPHPSDPMALGSRRFISVDPSFRYAYDSRRPDYGISLMSDLAAWHGLHDAQGYDPLLLQSTALARSIANRTSGSFYPSHGVVYSDPASPVLRLLAVQHLIGRWDLYQPGRLIPGAGFDMPGLANGVELVRGHPMWPLWRFREERPLAWFVETCAPAVSPEEALSLACANDPWRIAFTEEPVYLPRPAALPRVQVSMPSGREYLIEFDAALAGDTYICLSASQAPDWFVYTEDGVRSAALRTNGIIMGAVVPEGSRSVRFRYEPRSFWNGALLTLLGFLGMVMLARRQR